jgi:hypothetical protein
VVRKHSSKSCPRYPSSTAIWWLRQRATGRIRVVEFQRQHQALIIATTHGWARSPPSSTNELGFTLRRYDAAGAQDPEHGTWLIDVIEAESVRDQPGYQRSRQDVWLLVGRTRTLAQPPRGKSIASSRSTGWPFTFASGM